MITDIRFFFGTKGSLVTAFFFMFKIYIRDLKDCGIKRGEDYFVK